MLNFFPALKGRKNEKNIFLSISWSKIKRKFYCVWILPNHLCSFFVREFKEESKKEGNVVPSGGHETQLLKYQVRPPGGALRQHDRKSCRNPDDASVICWRCPLNTFGGVVNLHLQVYVHVVLVDVARSTADFGMRPPNALTRQMDQHLLSEAKRVCRQCRCKNATKKWEIWEFFVICC